jgi:hypothetical protein
MPGPWRILSQVINDRKMYIAGRQKNPAEPLHGGNVEYYGRYSDNRDSVEARVAELNAAGDA